MPQLISRYQIFIASPSDLAEEREAISEVINELNTTYGSPNNLHLELLKWENNSAPGISNISVQDVINKDIPTYDIFIGFLWMKFGTPTENYGSGTEAEFEIAYKKFKNDNPIQILFYFKNAVPQSLEEIDTDQLSKVREFKNKLGDKNTYYWEFTVREELEKFLRLHIPKRIDQLRAMQVESSQPLEEIEIKDKIESSDVEVIEAEELGIIDLEEFLADSFQQSQYSLVRLTEAMSWIGGEMRKKTNEINRTIAKNNNQPVSIKVQRNIFNRTAEAMNDFANRVEPEIPIYIENFENGIDSLSKLVSIYKTDFEKRYEGQLDILDESLESMLTQMSDSLEMTREFILSIETMPKVSKELNTARRNVASKMNDFLRKVEVSISIAGEVLKNIKSR
jgi:mRNA-degrading endonuclease RelE of RelBE toxin-antitoxin system